MSAPTLDGLTVAQLRDLSARALNAATVQEQKEKDARYVRFGNYRYDTKSRTIDCIRPFGLGAGDYATSAFHEATVNSLIEKQLRGDEYAPQMIAFLSHLTTLRGSK